MGSFASMKIGQVEVDPSALSKVLKSDEIAQVLDERGARIAESMNSEVGDDFAFRAFPSERGNRRRSFVVTYDDHGRRVCNGDPAIFQRHAR